MTVFRYRGIQAVVDTTEPAEFDIAAYGITEDALERIGARLKAMTFSPEDRTVGPIRIRELEGFDVVFVVTREDQRVVVTIGAFERPDPERPIERLLRGLGSVASIRGALGL